MWWLCRKYYPHEGGYDTSWRSKKQKHIIGVCPRDENREWGGTVYDLHRTVYN